MFNLFLLWFGVFVQLFRTRRALLCENLVLRQQLVVLKRQHPRPSLNLLDKLFWVAVHRFWSSWKQALIVVTPETVVSMASCRFSVVLEADFEGEKADWKKANSQGGSGVDLSHGARESDLGRTARP